MATPAKHVEWFIRSVVWHGPVVTPDTPVAGSTGGLVGGGLLFTQDTAGVPSAAENEDFFGWALATGDSGLASKAASPSSATAPSASRARRAAAGR